MFNLLSRLERRWLGHLPPQVRANQIIDIQGAMLFGVFITGLNFLPVVLRRLGAPPEALALYAAQPFIGFMLVPLAVWLMPRQRGLMRFAVAFWVASRSLFLAFAFITRWEWFLLLTSVFWVLETFPTPVYTRLMQAIYPADVRGQVMGNTRVGMSVVSLLVTLVTGWLLDTLGYRTLYPVMGAFALISLWRFAQLRFDEASVPLAAPTSTSGLGEALADPRFVLYLLGIAGFGVGFLAGGALYTIVQVDQLRLSNTEIAMLNSVQSAFFLLGYAVLGRLIDRLGGVQSLRWMFLLGAVTPLSYLLANQGWMLVPAFAVVGLVNAALDIGILNAVMQLARPSRLGEYSAVQTLVLGARGLAAPFLGVWLVQGAGLSYAATFALAAALMLVSAGALWRVRA